MIMNATFIYTLVAISLVVWSPASRADQEGCATCGQLVQVSGQFAHYPADRDLRIEGAPLGDATAFRDEIAGTNFTISVSGLPTGRYTVVIGEAETYFKETGQRVFDVTSGGTVLATNFDIVAAAGRPDKVCYITGQVEQQDNNAQGSLKLLFTARVNNAKFNTLEIRNAAGATLVSMEASDFADAFTWSARQPPAVNGPEIWKDPSAPIDARVKDLVRRLSLSEKVQQLRNAAPAIPRLGVPAYDYWNECLHGVARAGVATVFPQAIGMAATWDAPLAHKEAAVISTEARAIHNEYIRTHQGNSARYYGLTFWTPNINIFRDPRWGRGQETYGEDPFLTGSFAVAFIQGLQGNNPKYIKAMACAKHFAAHSGPEPLRHQFDARPSDRDLYDTYLPQFEMAVRDGHVGGVMGAYNALDGVPDCANHFLLTDLLRHRWGFDGYIVSDCDAIHDIYSGHHYADSLPAAAADAVGAGCDLCCGGSYNALLKAVQEGLITEPEIDQALFYVLKTRFRLGLFDPPQDVPWSKLTLADNDTPAHAALALKVAQESMVLLKNNGLLPLDRAKIKRIAVIGPNANSVPALLGNYYGTPSHPVTILEGIRQIAGPGAAVTDTPGCPIALLRDGSNKPTSEMTDAAIAAAKAADVVIYVGGLAAQYESEESTEANKYFGFNGGDRTRIELPSPQEDLLEALHATGKPIVFVNCSGSAIAMPWEAKHLAAIVQAWYPGEEGGTAVAQVLFGKVDPAGRLPITFYRSTRDLPPFEDYSMRDRTYRYYNGKPLFAFGHGLSYTTFSYRGAKLDKSTIEPAEILRVSFTVKNTGRQGGDEVSQVYFRQIHPAESQPKDALCGFVRIHLKRGETANVAMKIPAKRFRSWDGTKRAYVVEPGKYQVLIGGASDDIRLKIPFTISKPSLATSDSAP